MKPTSGKVFLDSNICLYLFDQDNIKASIAEALFTNDAIVSTQVLAETANVLLKKFKFSREDAANTVRFISKRLIVKAVTPAVIDTALGIFSRYGFSLYDSIILAAALDADCTILYSEDLQHQQVIDHPDSTLNRKLTVINPFL